MRLAQHVIEKKLSNSSLLSDATLDKDAHHIDDDDFVFNHVGLSSTEADHLLAKYGRNELPEKIIPKWYIFVSQLWQPMPIMIWIAIIIEIAIQNYIDFAILIFIQFGNASIAFYEITKAGDAVAALKASLKAKAYVKRDGVFKEINAAFVVPGDLVSLTSGSAIPADCRINHGEIDVDQAALTGESLPVTMYKGDSCKMGSTVVRGETEATVEFTGAETFFGKTAQMLQSNDEYSNLQIILLKIVSVLVIISVVLCAIVLGYTASLTSFTEGLSFAVVLMVASVPMAIEIVTTTTLALGSKNLTKHGAIVSRLAAIEDLAGMSILCSDKTGTLTLNTMVIQDYTPIYKDGETQYSLLRYAAMAAKWKEPPKDALDTLVLNAVDKDSLLKCEQTEFLPFDPVVKRTGGTIIENNKRYKTTKGAPHVLLKLLPDNSYCNNIRHRVEEDVLQLGLKGIRSLAVAKTDDNDQWELLGLLTFLDPPRPDTAQTIADANKYGVLVKMITGDHLLIARETARALNMNDYIKSADGLPMLDPTTKVKPANLGRDYGDMCLAADGFAQVFPEHKYLIVECLRELGYKTGMTGDGVNDAPALKRADVGVAVHGATDAAKAAADIILTEPGLSTIVHGIIIARTIFVRIKNFINYRIAATLQLLLFFFIAVFAFKPIDYMPKDWENMYNNGEFPDDHEWPEFFHMPVLMLMLITLLNDVSLISIGYDNAEPRKDPEKWNLKSLFFISSVLAGAALLSSLLLLWWILDSWSHGSIFQVWGLGGLSYGKVTTVIYLKISISDFLTLFSARTGDLPFWGTYPAPILLAAGGMSLIVSTIIACSWPKSEPDKILAIGLGYGKPYALAVYVWIYCIVWWFIQDFFKVIAYKLMERYNWFGYNDTGKVVLSSSTIKYIEENKEKDLNATSSANKH